MSANTNRTCDFDTLQADTIEYIGATDLADGRPVRNLDDTDVRFQVIVTPDRVFTFKGRVLPRSVRQTLSSPDAPSIQDAFRNPDGVSPRDQAMADALNHAQNHWKPIGSMSYDDYQAERAKRIERSSNWTSRTTTSHPNPNRQRQTTADSDLAAGA